MEAGRADSGLPDSKGEGEGKNGSTLEKRKLDSESGAEPQLKRQASSGTGKNYIIYENEDSFLKEYII